MWNLVPWPGIKPGSPDRELGVLITGPPGKSLEENFYFKVSNRDFLSGPVVKNPPCNTGDMSSISSRRMKIPHAMGHGMWHMPWDTSLQVLNLRTTTRESACHSKRALVVRPSPDTIKQCPAVRHTRCFSHEPLSVNTPAANQKV